MDMLQLGKKGHISRRMFLWVKLYFYVNQIFALVLGSCKDSQSVQYFPECDFLHTDLKTRARTLSSKG